MRQTNIFISLNFSFFFLLWTQNRAWGKRGIWESPKRELGIVVDAAQRGFKQAIFNSIIAICRVLVFIDSANKCSCEYSLCWKAVTSVNFCLRSFSEITQAFIFYWCSKCRLETCWNMNKIMLTNWDNIQGVSTISGNPIFNLSLQLPFHCLISCLLANFIMAHTVRKKKSWVLLLQMRRYPEKTWTSSGNVFSYFASWEQKKITI